MSNLEAQSLGRFAVEAAELIEATKLLPVFKPINDHDRTWTRLTSNIVTVKENGQQVSFFTVPIDPFHREHQLQVMKNQTLLTTIREKNDQTELEPSLSESEQLELTVLVAALLEVLKQVYTFTPKANA
jgi:hypothetical protein